MEEIDLKDLLTYFLKKISIILIVSVVVMVLGILYSVLLKKPLYYGNVTLVLVQENNSYSQGNTLTQSDIVLNQKLVATYSEIIKSNRVLNRVIEELRLDYTVGQLKNRITVSSVSDTEIIKIAVSDLDNNEAARIANKIAYVFQDEITDIYNIENVSIIDAAVASKTPYNIHTVRDAVIYFAVGFILVVGVLFVIYYFDTSIKSSEEVEKRLGIPVIGTVPLSRKGRR